MLSSKCNWYCLSVYSNVSTEELSIDAMLGILEEHCKTHYISWNPVYIEEGGERDETENVDPKFSFYVRTNGKAMAIKGIPKESKIWLHNKRKTPSPKIDDEFKLKIRQIILKRLTPDILRVDLSKLWEDEHWGDIFCALSNKDCMNTAIEAIGELMPRLHSLDLTNNYISDLSAFEGIESHLPELKTILLKGNQLKNLESLKIFEKLPLVELELEGNPVSTDAYRLDVAKLLPNLKIVDGRPVQRKTIRRLLAESPRERSNSNETSKDNMLKINRASSRSCSVENIFNNDHKESHPEALITTSIDSFSVPLSTNISDKLQNSNCSSNTQTVSATAVANGNKIDIDVAQPTKNPNRKRATVENSENLQSEKSYSYIPISNDLDNALDIKFFPNTETVQIAEILSVSEYLNESKSCKVTKFSTDNEISPITQSCSADSSQELVIANKNKIDTNIPQPTQTPDKIAESSESLHRTEIVSKNHIRLLKESCNDMDSVLDTKIATSIDNCSTPLKSDPQATKLSTNIIISPIAKSCSVTENHPTEIDKNHLDTLKSIILDPNMCCLNPENSTNSKTIPTTLSPSGDNLRTAVVSPTEKLSFQNRKNYEQLPLEASTNLNYNNISCSLSNLIVKEEDSMKNVNTTLSDDAIISAISKGKIERDSSMAVKDILSDKNTNTVKQQSSQNTNTQRIAAHNDLQLFLNAYLNAFDNKQEQLRWFYHEKAMVAFFENEKDDFHEMGLDDALARFRELPQTTKHLLPSITVNLNVLKPDRICFNISGIQKTDGYRYFIRTFVLVPLPNVVTDFRIWNEYIYTGNTTCCKKIALEGEMLMPISYFELFTEMFLFEIERRLAMFSEITNMKPDWCYKCLVDWNWNMDDALMIFTKMNQQKLIPDVAFMPTH
ncbi:uncharacterized protein LOC117571406 [Drosophila albomicans]|uniref:Uncharacterized protein LOC117571406 n=1 Tax=Drosophila albomicans TaxID=7291 RepID=A0A6P8XBH0_DROAB|nr:uncharacterized protein LOC117571406 [Drosophila albomicans]